MPHVHIHILPRKKGDFEKNDEVYDAIDEAAKDMRRCCCVCASMVVWAGHAEGCGRGGRGGCG